MCIQSGRRVDRVTDKVSDGRSWGLPQSLVFCWMGCATATSYAPLPAQTAAQANSNAFQNPQRVMIEGFDGEAM